MTASTRPSSGRRLVRALPFGWLLVFFLLPFGIVLKISLSEQALSQPPYRPLAPGTLDPAAWADFAAGLSAESYRVLASDRLYLDAALSSVAIAALATFLIALVGYPLALALARSPRRWRGLLVALVIVPFWTSFLIRVYAWIAILKDDGWLNAALLWLGAIGAPLRILNTDAAVLIGIVYAYLPFLVLPVYASLERLDPVLPEAAADLGATPFATFWTVTFRLSLPGLLAGALLCFIPAFGEFIVPDLLGGAETLMIGRTLWSEFFSNRDWPLASAVAVAMLLALVVPVAFLREIESRRLERLR